MAARFMVTNGGPHSPETWAITTAEEIFVISPDLAGDRMMLAKRLQLQLSEVLVAHFNAIQTSERAELTNNKDVRLNVSNEVDVAESNEEADEMMVAVQGVLKGSPWEEQYNNPDVVKAAKVIIASHLMTLKDIERRYVK